MKRAFSLVEFIFMAILLCVLLGLALIKIIHHQDESTHRRQASELARLIQDLAVYFRAHQDFAPQISSMSKVPLSATQRADEWQYLVKNKPCVQLKLLRLASGKASGAVLIKSLAGELDRSCLQVLDEQVLKRAFSGTYTCSSAFLSDGSGSNTRYLSAKERSDEGDLAATAAGANLAGCSSATAKEQNADHPVIRQIFDARKRPIVVLSFATDFGNF